jgi:hypothetical protein
MAEISTLREVFRKEGLQFVHKLFDDFVIISEKLSATRFAFEKNEKGELEFFRKDGKITAIDRTLNQLFESPINYISKLPKDVLEQIPIGYRYGFRYFHSNTPINIEYDRVPMNGLVLTDIKKSSDGKIVDDISILNAISDLLMVEKPPIIWYGKLDDSQKTRLMEYLRTPEDQLIKKFETASFTKYIISILNPSMKKTSLNVDIEKPIESIVFKFIGSNKNEVFYAKAVDPMIQKINQTNDGEREPQDMYGIILSDIVEFVKINGLQKYAIPEGTNEERFIELMCLIYNDFIKKNGYRFEGVEMDLLSFANTPEFNLNSGFIPNTKTRELIKSSSINKNIFKILVSAFYKPKKRPFGTMTQMLVDDLRELSRKIKTKVDPTEKTEESAIPTFEEYLNAKNQKSWSIKD